MNPTKEMVLTLFSDNTLKQVQKQFKDGTQIIPIENFNMSFRLYKAKKGNINLELLIQMPFETTSTSEIPGIGRGRVVETVMFFKPIGYYSEKKGVFSSTLEITIPKEFERDLDFLISNHKITSKYKINRLSMKENSVLAAFSMEANLQAMKYQDTSFTANGLSCDIFLTFEGFPQVFLDDKYGIEGPIAAYKLREENMIFPMLYNTDIFDKYYEMSLLTAFKQI